jgi:hypothetical protein
MLEKQKRNQLVFHSIYRFRSTSYRRFLQSYIYDCMHNKKKVTYDSLLTTEIISGKSSSANISLSFDERLFLSRLFPY